MWIARSKDGELNIFEDEPYRFQEQSWMADNYDNIGDIINPQVLEQFNDITWDSEPVPVRLIRKQ